MPCERWTHWSKVVTMETAAEVEQWKDLCRKLNAENDRLHLERQVRELKSENEKLRHLCLIAHRWMGRALYDGSARRYEYESITECMRRLGIEVDDG